MDQTNPLQLLQKGFHVALGATTSVVESLQDPTKRQENMAHLRLDPLQLAQILEQKGAVTEQDARILVDTLMAQQGNGNWNGASTQTTTVNASTVSSTPPGTQTELEELTAQLAAIRAELERERS
jgi:multidrug resistance efflux pump